MPSNPYTDPSNGVLIAWILLAVLFMGVGICFRRVPASRILELDRGVIYWAYIRELQATRDNEKALAKAAKYYKRFGLFFVLFAALHVFIVTAVLLYRLFGNV